MTPEARARARIDELLRECGWQLQDRDEINLGAGLGVAVREFLLPSGAADYLLFIDRHACGISRGSDARCAIPVPQHLAEDHAEWAKQCSHRAEHNTGGHSRIRRECAG